METRTVAHSSFCALPAGELSVHKERQHWTKHYEQHLRSNLIWAKGYVEENYRQPVELKRHAASLLTLLRQAQARASLHGLAVEIIARLHPWPSYWGLWRDWEQALDFAIDVSARLGWRSHQALFLSYLAHILFYTGKLEQAADVGKAAVGLAQESHTPLALAYGGNVVVSTFVIAGRMEEAQAHLSVWLHQLTAGKIPGGAITKPDQANALAMLRLKQVDLLRRRGELRDAADQASEVINLLETFDETDQNFLAHAYRDRSITLLGLGEYTSAVADLRHAEMIFAQVGDTFARSLVLSSLGLLYWSTGEFVLAEEAIRHGIKLNQDLGARWHLIHEIGNLGLIYLCQGNLQQALHYFEDQQRMAVQFGEIKESKRSTGNRGIARFHLGEYERAREDLEEELAFFGTQGYRAYVGCTLVNLSWCYSALGQQDKARTFAEQAVALGQETGSVALQIVALRCMAEYLPPSTQEEYLRRALHLAQGKRRFDEAASLLSLAGITEDGVEQSALWRKGCRLLEEMHASVWVKNRSPHQPPRLPLLY